MKLQMFNYSVPKNQSDDTLDVFIDGDIVDAPTEEFYKNWFGDDTSTSFKSLRDTILNSSAKRVNIHINSGGGMMSDAFAMHDFIKENIANGKNWHTYGKGIVASAATYPLLAGGDNMHISENCFFMIHNASGGVYGSVDEIESYAATIRKFNNAARDLYADCFNQSTDTIAEWMDAETWWTGTDMKDMGLIPEKNCGPAENCITNAIPVEKWPFNNKAILNKINNSIKTPQNTFDMNLKKIGETVANSVREALKNAGLIKDEKVGNINLAEFETALTNGISTSFTELETEISEGISNGIAEGLKGDVFKNAVDAAVKNALATVPENINQAINNATADFVKKGDLEQVKNDIADKLGTPKMRKTNTAAEKESIEDTEGISWNINH